MSRSGSKRKSSETDTDDYEPGTAVSSGGRAAEVPRKQQSSPYIGVTKVCHCDSSLPSHPSPSRFDPLPYTCATSAYRQT